MQAINQRNLSNYTADHWTWYELRWVYLYRDFQYLYCFRSAVRSPWMQRAECMHWSIPFYIGGDLSIHGYGYLQGVLEPIPCRYRAATKVSLASKFIRGFSTVQGDGTSKSLTVQRSTVYSVSIQNIYLVFLVFTTPKNFRLKFSIKLFSIKLFYLI